MPKRIVPSSNQAGYELTFIPSPKAPMETITNILPPQEYFDFNRSVEILFRESKEDLDYYNARRELAGTLMTSLRQVIQYWAPAQNAVLLHGATIGLNRHRGFVAYGASGQGKSTLTRLSPLALSEEWSLVFKENGRWYSSAPPFRIDALDRPGQIPAEGLLHLQHAPPLLTQKLSASEAVRSLFAQTLHGKLSAQQQKRLATTVLSLAAAVPVFRFAFSPDASVIKQLQDVP